LISKIKLDERSIGRNRDQGVSDPEDSVIPDDLFAKLLEMMVPSSPNNPFKSSRVRNYLIVNVLIQTGIRRGAVGKMKISDCQFDGSYDRISIYRTKNDPSDPRLEKAYQKSKAHLATIDRALMEQIKFYIDHIRSQFPQKQPHDFVFVSEKDSKGTVGQPLSLKSINAIFEKLSKVLGFHVHPHLLRHKWNEIFDQEGERKGVNAALLEDIRKYAMGWSQNSTMSQTYNSKRLAVKVRELSKAHQHRVDSQT
jgi:integrase